MLPIPQAAGLLALVLLLAGGCGSARSDAAARWQGRIDTLAGGTVVVHNPSQGLWTESDAWRVVEELRIGTVDGTGPEVFGRIRDIAVDAEGRIWVLERQARELRVFDASGAHVRSVGRHGEGPGEFNVPMGMAWAGDGTLWVVDPGNTRISVFDSSGTLLGSHPLALRVVSSWAGAFDERGRFYFYADRRTSAGVDIYLVRHDSNLVPLDSTVPPELSEERPSFDLQLGAARIGYPIPFTSSMRWRFDRSGHLWFAETGAYRLYERTFAGETVRIVEREHTPLEVTTEDIDSAVAGMTQFIEAGGKVDRSKFPEVKPAIDRFYVDDPGRLWVLPVAPRGFEGRLFDVFDVEGRYLGRVELPFRLDTSVPPVFRHDTLYAVTRDELDVPYVVRARIVKSEQETATTEQGARSGPEWSTTVLLAFHLALFTRVLS